MTGWGYFLIAYCVVALGTFAPVLIAILKKIDLKEAQFSFSDSPYFSNETKVNLEQHYSRLNGTLVFWKNNAAKYGRFHHYSIGWTIVGGICIPFLAQAINADPWSKWTLTIISAHVAVLYVAQKGFKVEQNFKNYRLGESEYYDIRRRLLDQPYRLGTDEREQVDNYFTLVETLRQDMRTREVDGIASFDETDRRARETGQRGKEHGQNARNAPRPPHSPTA
jgi:hypothetical protein